MTHNKESQNFGVKLTNELMTDIIGAIIPGALFMVCLIIGVVTPVLVIFTKIHLMDLHGLPDSLPWVLLIMCMILSYVFGLIFYRADIKVPDKEDIERQIVETIVHFSDDNESELVQKLKYTANVLRWHCEQARGRCEDNTLISVTLDKLKEYCGIMEDRSILSHKDIFKVLFPEDYIQDNGQLGFDSIEVLNYYKALFLNLPAVFDRYENKPFLRSIYHFLDKSKVDEYVKHKISVEKLQTACRKANLSTVDFKALMESSIEDGDGNLRRILLLMYHCILNAQCELGCCAKIRGEFPYMNYYKYLLNRNLHECIKHVDWCSRVSRTKNQVNQYKIEIQTFASEAYALLNKNESHIRMSSASWHVSYRVKFVSLCMTAFIPFLLLLLFLTEDIKCSWYCPQSTLNSLWILILFPLSIYLLSSLIQRRITKFIHYQRLRELYYTLFVYDEYSSIIKIRKGALSDINYYVNSEKTPASINVNATIRSHLNQRII